ELRREEAEQSARLPPGNKAQVSGRGRGMGLPAEAASSEGGVLMLCGQATLRNRASATVNSCSGSGF
ncbi:MAG: hypothetical protein QME94_11165, partial [Anaerolineae bacterium]|nr:hypothetical protein [Anaerolineae bacterium]